MTMAEILTFLIHQLDSKSGTIKNLQQRDHESPVGRKKKKIDSEEEEYGLEECNESSATAARKKKKYTK